MAGRSRRMTLPSTQGREDPIYKPATKPASDPVRSYKLVEGTERGLIAMSSCHSDGWCRHMERASF